MSSKSLVCVRTSTPPELPVASKKFHLMMSGVLKMKPPTLFGLLERDCQVRLPETSFNCCQFNVYLYSRHSMPALFYSDGSGYCEQQFFYLGVNDPLAALELTFLFFIILGIQCC
jgi:hypothetical protein